MAAQVPLSDAHHPASPVQQVIEKKSVPQRTKKKLIRRTGTVRRVGLRA
jgi:hypothetical protein